MLFRKRGDADTEIPERLDEFHELVGVCETFGMRDPVGVRVSGRVAPQREDVAHPRRGVLPDHVTQFERRVVHGSEMAHWRQRRLGRDALSNANCAISRRSPGSVRDRDKGRLQRFELTDRLPELPLAGVGLRREELERKRAARLEQVANRARGGELRHRHGQEANPIWLGDTRAMPDGPLDRADLSARVRRALDEFLAERRAELVAFSPELTAAADVLTTFVLDGGKRLRPAFCYWGWRGAGAPDNDAIVTAAAALELVHACALIHDDVMDASATRRGRPSVHHEFAARHAAARWRGSAERFGVAAAILLGDLCLVWADEMLASSRLTAEAVARGRLPYDQMRVELTAGQ